MKYKFQSYINKTTPAAPLAVFRIGFGLMMLASIIRFWAKGWIETVYIAPKFHFTYFGFDWVKPLDNYTYLLFFICGLSAFFVALGLKYRLAIITFFISFTYIELIDKTTYLNHYYFISIVSFVMCFLPANAYFSIDAIRRKVSYTSIPKWTIDCIKLLLAIVYVYAGLAKINSDWMNRAMPLKILVSSCHELVGYAVRLGNSFFITLQTYPIDSVFLCRIFSCIYQSTIQYRYVSLCDDCFSIDIF